jgi:hypothetical protein
MPFAMINAQFQLLLDSRFCTKPSTWQRAMTPRQPPSTNALADARIDRARLTFGEETELLTKGATIALRNYLLDGKLIQVSLYENGRIEQRDTASYVAKNLEPDNQNHG